MNPYIGHPSQACGIDEVELRRGQGKGMTLLEVRNGQGLHITLNADRAMDIPRLSFKGYNMGYFAPCGYVAPTYFVRPGLGFLKSFTAGFLTTCGLTAAGSPCVDEGEELPLHGFVAHLPCEDYSYEENEDAFLIHGRVRQAELYGDKLVLHRTLTVSKTENRIDLSDRVENVGNKVSPCMHLYHFNMGYPLLSETAKLSIPSTEMSGRDELARTKEDMALTMEKPQEGYSEVCFFHNVKEKDGLARVGIYNPAISAGLVMSFDKSTLPYFTQWKMMGIGDYALGLEPGNCIPDGRKAARESGQLKFLSPGESVTFKVSFTFTEQESDITSL